MLKLIVQCLTKRLHVVFNAHDLQLSKPKERKENLTVTDPVYATFQSLPSEFDRHLSCDTRVLLLYVIQGFESAQKGKAILV